MTAAVIAFGLASIRTLGRISWLALVGVVSILTSGESLYKFHLNLLPANSMCIVFVVAIAVGVQDRPAAAPKDVPWISDFHLVGSPTFGEAITAVTGFTYAYGSIPAYFPIYAEMRDPRKYTRCVVISHIAMTTIYLVVGCVVYYYCGSYVSSPALGSAGGTMKKIAYGIALPGLLISATLFIHVSISTIPCALQHLYVNVS